MMTIMKVEDDAALSSYLVKQLQPLTEADPNILAKYVGALLKNNKAKEELQEFCTEKLVDFLGEDSKTFVINLFRALEDGTIATRQEEIDTRVEDEPSSLLAPTLARVLSTGDHTEPKSLIQSQKQSDTNNLGSTDHEEEVSDDEDDDRNHKHRRRAERSRSLDRDTQDGPIRKRSRSDDNNAPEEFQRGPSSYLEKDGLPKRWMGRDHTSGLGSRLGMDANQRGLSRGASMLRNDIQGSGFEHQNGLSRGHMGRGRGGTPSLLGPREPRLAPSDASDPNGFMLAPGLSNLYSGRAGPGRGNPSHSPWLGFNRFKGIANGTLDPSLSLNTGSRGVSLGPAVGVGMNIGLGISLRPRCPDFEERGYCLRGDLCPMEHGANRIVVEDVQSLSKFNLPVALPSGRGMTLGTVSVSSSSLAPYSPNLGVSNIVSRDATMSSLADTPFSKLASGSIVSSEPDLYDPDQPLWNKERRALLVDCLRKLPSLRKDNDFENMVLERSQRQSPEDEDYGRIIKPQVSGSGASGQSVWNRIGHSDQGDAKDGSIPMLNDPPVESSQFPKFLKREEHGLQSSPGKWKNDLDEKSLRTSRGTLLKSGGNGATEGEPGLKHAVFHPHGGHSLRHPGERAQNTLYVGCLPSNPNRRELLMAHFQKFGDIVDIRVPVHGDRAFVQFLRHEDAEAALTSPEAVMGNRFIRLSWAKRDSIPVSSMESTVVLPPLMPGKDNDLGDIHGLVPDTLGSNIKGKKHADNVPAIFEGLRSKQAEKSGPLLQPNAAQKKQEELEQMKETIRKKQEELAQKRDEFRRKLERLSKQQGNGITADLELDSHSSAKGTSSDQTATKEVLAEKEIDPKSVHREASFVPSAVEKASSIADQAVLGLAKDSAKQPLGLGQVSSGTLSQASPRGLRGFPLSSSPGVAGSQWGPLRYKIDNRTTVFRVLAPVPDSLLDEAILKNHFQFFGDIANLEIEGLDKNEEPIRTENTSIKVTFTTRSAAEKAFTQGRWFQGTTLQFSWVNPQTSASTSGMISDVVHAEVKNCLISGSNGKSREEGQSTRMRTSTSGEGSHIDGCEVEGRSKSNGSPRLTHGLEKAPEEGSPMVLKIDD